MLSLWVQKVWFSNPNSSKLDLATPNSLAFTVQGGCCERGHLEVHFPCCCAQQNFRACGKGLQTEMALPQSPLPAMQFKCMISSDINNLEGLQIINIGIV